MDILITFFLSVSSFLSTLFGEHQNVPIEEKTIMVASSSTVVSTTTENGSSKIVVSATSSNTLVYKNDTYGFTLIFPEQWKEYRTSLNKNDTCFGLMDQDCIFKIGVYTKAEWKSLLEESKDEAGILPNYLSENEAYVFTADSAQDFSDKVIPIVGLRNTILASFSLFDKSPSALKNSYQR